MRDMQFVDHYLDTHLDEISSSFRVCARSRVWRLRIGD